MSHDRPKQAAGADRSAASGVHGGSAVDADVEGYRSEAREAGSVEPAPPGEAGRGSSPLDRLTDPGVLTAYVVGPGPRPRIHGYDVEDDLARHYGWTEVLGLLLVGRLLEPERVRALEIALTFLAPVSVADGPGHAALLGRVSGAPFRSIVGLGAVALASEAARVVDEHSDWLAWIEQPARSRGRAPERFLASSEPERDRVRRLRKLLEDAEIRLDALAAGPRPVAALLAVLAHCGLGVEAMTTAWVVARLAATAAEAAARPAVRFAEYPANLPPLEPLEPSGDGSEAGPVGAPSNPSRPNER